MSRPSPRTPRLASDIVRSLVAICACIVLSLVFAFSGFVGETDSTRVSLYLSWCVLVLTMTVLAFVAFAGADPPTLQRWLVATRPPDNRFVRFWWTTLGGGAVWWAISGTAVTMWTLVNLALQATIPTPRLVILGVAVVVASYAMIIVSYAVQFARIDAVHGGFDFPGEVRPRFIDYVYLAAQVSTTFGSSDVSLTTSRARQSVTGQSLLAMAFNTVIISLFVSVLRRAAQPAA